MLKRSLYAAIQENLGDPKEVFVEDFLRVGCSYRLSLQAQGLPPSRKEEPQQALLRNTERSAKSLVSKYLRECFGQQFTDGFYHSEGAVLARIEGFLNGTLVEVAIVPDAMHSNGELMKLPRRTILAACVKAAMLGHDEVLVIAINRNTQGWSFWKLSGDIEGVAGPVLHDIEYTNRLLSGDAIRAATADRRTCKVCPMRKHCDLEPTENPPPYSIKGVSAQKEVDTRLALEGYLWRLNTRPNGRRTQCIHPSEISTTDCDRVIAYGLMGTKEKRAVDPNLRRIFDFGHIFHDWLQAALKWAVPEFEEEVPVSHGELNIYGHCDGRAGDRGVEIKSISDKGYEKLFGAKKAHRQQGTVYGSLLDLEALDYIYVNKETGDVAIYNVPLEENVWHEIAARARNIITQVEKGHLPPQIDTESTCQSCKYAWTCKPNLKKSGFSRSSGTTPRRFTR